MPCVRVCLCVPSPQRQLGATLANSERSAEAIPNYERALAIKPNYTRGVLNMGISQANVGNYMVRAVPCVCVRVSPSQCSWCGCVWVPP